MQEECCGHSVNRLLWAMVALFYVDGRPVDGNGISRKVLDSGHATYDTELAGKDFAYDGVKSLFTLGPLPRNKLEFTIVLEDVVNRNNGNQSPASPNNDRKRQRRSYNSKTFKVEISFAAKIPIQSIANALQGQESENSQEALRVLDIVLRQHASKQGCLLVRQSFFHNDPKNFVDVGGGVLGCRGFHSSFRTTQGGLSLNIVTFGQQSHSMLFLVQLCNFITNLPFRLSDVSTTMIIQPGPVVDFLIANQNVKDPFQIDWAKAKRTLKNLRIKTNPANTEFKISGLSEKPYKEQMYASLILIASSFAHDAKTNRVFLIVLHIQSMTKGKDEDGEIQTVEVNVCDYFVNRRNIELRYSGDLPRINVGKPKRLLTSLWR
ncbi:hypothetical protein RHGRI_003965 [Rhododendron griersonianum]|uniref:PAZ domain-containing protein n=1 Tax=Rhododendron griersonianum TaxID=479676 RepID=A0AAV6L7V6_9ERIC|nr:hypothetical protein RHGRI_003965 [Rhododendron griersonianum]